VALAAAGFPTNREERLLRVQCKPWSTSGLPERLR